MIHRLTIVLAISACALSAQTKKILVMGAGPDVKEYQSASPKANVIPVTKETVMKEIADADDLFAPPRRDMTLERLRCEKTIGHGQCPSRERR